MHTLGLPVLIPKLFSSFGTYHYYLVFWTLLSFGIPGSSFDSLAQKIGGWFLFTSFWTKLSKRTASYLLPMNQTDGVLENVVAQVVKSQRVDCPCS